ncbi:ParA family protein [Leptolyngbya sp. FACHB-711]|uniref:ParA family protein n=1 Tax=Leptolyngbya sp. FACHB-711 TaxID=2692813 RepID=UPI001681DA90|nr:ParA family protein [Leptolyngbya sp. FACHB-711]MBD2025237.1 ParA family protein [Leptolyngbya sp. FACHB-711]
MLTIACWAMKGGTGKSSTVLNLGAALSRSKLKTVVIDLDGQRTLSFGLGMDGKTPTAIDWLARDKPSAPLETQVKNLSIIPGDMGMFRLVSQSEIFTQSLKRIRPLGFDICLMDCPPNLGLISVQAVLAADRVLLPTLCEPAALKGLSEAISLIRDDSPDKPIEVLRCRYKRSLVLTREADDLLVTSAEDFNYRLLHTVIPENIAVAEAIAQQQPVLEYAPKSPGAIAYKSLGKELLKIWKVKA